MKPILVIWKKYNESMSLQQMADIQKRLENKLGEDYYCLIIISDRDQAQVFTDREILPTELQLEFDKIYNA